MAVFSHVVVVVIDPGDQIAQVGEVAYVQPERQHLPSSSASPHTAGENQHNTIHLVTDMRTSAREVFGHSRARS